MSDERYSTLRSTAVHEAGHAVMAYLLRRSFTAITVTEDDYALGHVKTRPVGDWFRPDEEMNARTRSLIEDHAMISLAGAETESAWFARLTDAPPDWQKQVDEAARQDMYAATWLWADSFVGAGGPELEAYLEWLRQRVLAYTGRGADFDPGQYFQPVDDFVAEHMRFGQPRFWSMVYALADAVQEAGTLNGHRARQVLRNADPWFLEAEQIAAKVRSWHVASVGAGPAGERSK